MFNIGMPELLLILVVALIIMGPKKLPELAKSLGRGLREFRKATDDIKDSLEKDLRPDGPKGPGGSKPPGGPKPPGDTKPPGDPRPSASPNLIAGNSVQEPPPADAGPDRPAEAPPPDSGKREPGHGD
jgi:TatA/E family protein of Tat protein translocase